MDVHTESSNGKASIRLKGRFDFTAHRVFKQAYEAVLGDKEANEVELDMSAVEYLDSSALGMLLILRDRAKETTKTVTLGSCSTPVKEVLRVANFDKLFATA
ncbi:MAG: anti-sigma factor antagonist [Burkholderiaceae bacterium]|nr:MAG: anti-sigma factor antagonist [Burkholderiaceae bacterium]